MLPVHGNRIIDDPFDPQKNVPALKKQTSPVPAPEKEGLRTELVWDE